LELALQDDLGNEDHYLERIVIAGNYCKDLLFELSHYGINRLSLFPDLDGLSDYLAWFMENSKSYAEP
jgi:hypothetical protein